MISFVLWIIKFLSKSEQKFRSFFICFPIFSSLMCTLVCCVCVCKYDYSILFPYYKSYRTIWDWQKLYNAEQCQSSTHTQSVIWLRPDDGHYSRFLTNGISIDLQFALFFAQQTNVIFNTFDRFSQVEDGLRWSKLFNFKLELWNAMNI